MGTNTVLASIVERNDDRLHLVRERSRITRLGAGVDATRRLDEAAIERTLEAVRELSADARAHGAETVHGVGTSAVRDAENRDAFVDLARAMLDSFEVIDGAREAELTFRGALFGLPDRDDRFTVVDIGGGSTEVVCGARGIVERRASANVGSVRLSERHGVGDACVSDARRAAMTSDIERALREVPIAPPLVMLAGTATNIAAVALSIDLARGTGSAHGVQVSAHALRDAIERIVTADRRSRANMIGIERGREDVIVAGALIFEHVLDRSGAAEVTISDGGVRFGLALEVLG